MSMARQKAKGPAATGIAPDHGSTNTPPNEMIMNRTEDSMVQAGAARDARGLDYMGANQHAQICAGAASEVWP